MTLENSNAGPVHDVGGNLSNEPIVHEQHHILPWELRVNAALWILADATRPGGRRMTVDELRRGIESLSPEDYRTLGYFEKWLLSMIAIMEERGLVNAADLERRVAELRSKHEREHHG